MTSADALLGRTLKHYAVEELLGRGGMGVVYRALDTKLCRPVALKLPRPELMADPGRRARFLQEACSAASLTHPAIAQIYDIDEDGGNLFIAMEYIDGRTVSRLIADGEMDLLSAVEIARQVSEGLGRAHALGLIHRDIKSDNIMVTSEGHAKLLDFGLAKLFEAAPDAGDAATATLAGTGGGTQTLPGPASPTQTMVGTVRGTISYMSPEQARGRSLTPASDVFSLGIVLYEMACGRRPFAGDTPLDTMHSIAFDEPTPATIVRRDLPFQLQRILTRCLRKKAEDRYPEASALAADLKILKRALDSGTREVVPPIERLKHWAARLTASFPLGRNGLFVAGAAALASVLFIVAKVQWGNLLTLGLVALLAFRGARNRKVRRLKDVAARAAKDPNVRAVLIQEERLTVVLDRASAATNIHITSLIDAVNKRVYFGNRAAADIRAGLTEAEYEAVLKTPGIVYARDDAGRPAA